MGVYPCMGCKKRKLHCHETCHEYKKKVFVNRILKDRYNRQENGDHEYLNMVRGKAYK